jgi:hypothetical protein
MVCCLIKHKIYTSLRTVASLFSNAVI